MTLHDQAARDTIRHGLGATLVVEAAAGTGKTTELVARIVAVLREGHTTLDRMVAVTFTEKAAGEMKLRLRAELERQRGEAGLDATAREHLSAALAALETAHISTMHAFCGDVLSERPVEARIDPGFVVATQEEADALAAQVFDAWFQRVLSDPPEGVRRVLARHAPSGPSPRQELRTAVTTLINQRDFDTPWRRDGFARTDVLDRVVELLQDLARRLPQRGKPHDYLVRSLSAVAETCREIDTREHAEGIERDYDTIEADLRRLLKQPIWKQTGTGKYLEEGVLRSDVIEQRARVHGALELCMQACEADLAACLHRDLQPVVALYEAAKERAGMLDFLDLLLRVRDTLRDHAVVRQELRERFTHVFIDEFQDTDPLQAEIMLRLCGDDDPVDDTRCHVTPGKLFVVGDPKQSIYRFRRADVSLYARIKRKLVLAGAQVLQLTTSFRSRPALQSVVNAAFASSMIATDDGSQPAYHALTPFRADTTSQPSVVALPVPRPYSSRGNIAGFAIEESLPGAVGAFVKYLIDESGYRVHEPEQGEVPLQARHICLLFRRMRSGPKDVARPYVRALEAHNIPHVLMGGRSFHSREEVIALRAALHAIEWPDDLLHVYATLRGPLLSLSDEQLLIYRERAGSLHPLARAAESLADDPDTREVASALKILRKLHLGRNRRPIAETIGRLLRETRAHAGFAIWPAGEQVLANVLRIQDDARRFELRGTTSFRAFVEHMSQQADEANAGEAPVVEEVTDGVRVMTVHNAKGLEFPVVILCDPTATRRSRTPSRHVDHTRGLWVCPLAGCIPAELREQQATILRHEDEESIRLTYVAATRARDMLVVPTVGDKRVEGWLDMLNPAVYPSPDRRREAVTAPACPAFGDDSVLEASFDARRDATDSVKPGQHAPEAGAHQVVWWDPAALALDPREPVGVRQRQLLQADAEAVRSQAGIELEARWQDAHRARIERGSAPTVVRTTVTALAHQQAEAATQTDASAAATAHHEASVSIVRVEPSAPARPSGRRFGTLVHAVLAERFAAPHLAAATIARSQARLLLASEDELSAAVDAVERAWQHPLLVRARKSRDCRAEVPLSLTLDDGALLEGIADLVFSETSETGKRWIVVDFKTDDPEGNLAYALQLQLYARAIRRATGVEADAILLAL